MHGSTPFFERLITAAVFTPVVLVVFWPVNFIPLSLGLASFYWWKRELTDAKAIRNRVILSMVFAEFIFYVIAVLWTVFTEPNLKLHF